MRYYISGQIANNPTYISDFEIAEMWLKLQGYEVINPCKFGEYSFFTYADYMKIDLTFTGNVRRYLYAVQLGAKQRRKDRTSRSEIVRQKG